MKNNLKIFLAIISLVFLRVKMRRSCKTDILRSFGLHGLLTPNKKNVLCPSLDWNCCSIHDQMKIHKKWSTHLKAQFQFHYI